MKDRVNLATIYMTNSNNNHILSDISIDNMQIAISFM